MRRKVKSLYDKYSEFQNFLDAQTKFLPHSVTPILRWYYYADGLTKAKCCPVCGNFIPSYSDKFCSHKCSTLAPDTGAKRGPKVDYEAKASDLESSLKKGYKLVKYGRSKSVFSHACGQEFELSNRAMLGSGKCPCLHKKLLKHTHGTLQEWHDDHETGFDVLKILGENAKLQCRVCGHKFETRKFYNRRCPKCFEGKLFVGKIITHEQYVEWLKENKPEFELLGQFVDHSTKAKYKHVCGRVFNVKPHRVTRKEFKCPTCAPCNKLRSCGAYREFERNGVILKVRGKEVFALEWLLRNTRLKIDDIFVDSEGVVPQVRYRPYRDKTTQTYYPDFFIPRQNKLIEVKDFNTMGLKGSFFYTKAEKLWKINCAKAKASIKSGFSFELLLFDKDNNPVQLPANWYEYSRAKMLRWLG